MKNTEPTSLKTGDIISEHQYYKVLRPSLDPNYGPGTTVENERGEQITINNKILAEGSYSAHQFDAIEYLSKTQIAQQLLALGSDVFEVSFNKQPQAKDINEAISNLNKGRIISTLDMKEAIIKVYNGQTRILRGYKIGSEPEFGRIKVVDLEVKFLRKDLGYRLVDLRDINYYICKGVKYIVK